MTHRERVEKSLRHKEPDRVPVDLGNSPTTGIHARAVAGLREYYGLERRPVKVWEPYQFLGEVEEDLLEVLGVDTVRFASPGTLFGFRNENWKEFRTWWGQTVLVAGGFQTAPAPGGGWYIYPQGDTSAAPSGHMPSNGYFFDAVIRQPAFDPENLRVEDNLEEFGPISEKDLKFYAQERTRLLSSDRAPIASFGGTAFGDIAHVPGPGLKSPRGIRDISEWYISTVTRQDLLHQIFDCQCDLALKNLARIHEKVGDAVSVVLTCGTDFGTQNSQFCSIATYNSLYAPYHKRVNDWIHRHTNWKSMKHSCGAVFSFIPHFIAAGFDILNPVQISAKDMDPQLLKREYGRDIVFWGGGVDTQKTLPFGTPEDVRREVLRLCEIFSPGGGFVFNTVHNIQATVPVENIVALVDAVKEFNGIK